MGDQLASLVRRLRLRAQMTQEALAECSGVSIRTLRGIETGKQPNPRITSVRQLANALELSRREREMLVAAALDGRDDTAYTVPIPRQLPPAPQGFTGRTGELAELTALLDSPANGPVVVGAAGGMGKTWLVLHWANQLAERFPDGQLFVNLRGFDPAAGPLPPETALRVFLHALGVAPAALPTEQDALVGLFRSLVADKRMLIVADNAADAGQVVPLLPGTPSVALLVTSRSWLPGLVTGHGAHPVLLDALPDADAHTLLADRLGGERLAAEPEAAADLVATCAGLPLALSIIAGRARTHPRLALAALATELRESGLYALDEGDPATSLPMVLASSYRVLTPDRTRALGLLGRAPGPDIGLAAAANLIGYPQAATVRLLRGLEQLSLIQETETGRWRMHDLIRQHTAEQAGHSLPDAERTAALRRVIGFYLHTAYAADRLFDPFRLSIPIPLEPAPDLQAHPLPDDLAAMTWFKAEHTNVMAAQRVAAEQGWDALVWQLAWSLNRFHYRQARFTEDIEAMRAGLAATERLGDPVSEITMLRLLGKAVARDGEHDRGLDLLREALALAERVGDGLQQGATHHALTVALGWRADPRQALEHAGHTLRLYRAHGPKWEGEALNLVGWYAARNGQYTRARAHCQAALASHRRNQDPGNIAITLDSLGFIDYHTGRHSVAIEEYQEAVALLRESADIFQLAETLESLGHPHRALGQHDEARAVWAEAQEWYANSLRPEAAQRTQGLLDELGGQPAPAPRSTGR